VVIMVRERTRRHQAASALTAFTLTTGLALAAAAPSAWATSADDIVFRSPAECKVRYRIPEEICSAISQRAWEVYVTQVPRFLTREECNRTYEVCVVLPADWVRLEVGPDSNRPTVRYAPPFWAINAQVATEDTPLTVLVDRGMQPLSVLNSASILPVGRFMPTPAMVRQRYVEALNSPPSGQVGDRAGQQQPARDPSTPQAVREPAAPQPTRGGAQPPPPPRRP
jgi:hypothetical protein